MLLITCFVVVIARDFHFCHNSPFLFVFPRESIIAMGSTACAQPCHDHGQAQVSSSTRVYIVICPYPRAFAGIR